MSRKYPLVLLGPGRLSKQDELRTAIDQGLTDLGLTPDDLEFLDSGNLGCSFTDLTARFPIAVWFGVPNSAGSPEDVALLKRILSRGGIPVYPVYDDVTNFRCSFPEQLHPINGLPWEVNRVVSELLGAFELTRRERQVFISYLRRDSAPIASQLFNALQHRGFQVFLDSASVKSGTVFQDVLMGRLGDVDLLIVLDSPGFRAESEWTLMEVGRARAMELGGLRLVWPNERRIGKYSDREWDDAFSLLETEGLKETDFVHVTGTSTPPSPADRILNTALVQRLIEMIEAVRIRTLAKRRDRLLVATKLRAEACGLTHHLVLHNKTGAGVLEASRHCHVELRQNVDTVARIYPIVGFPDAWVYQSRHIAATNHSAPVVKTCIVYDDLMKTAELGQHLKWLSDRVADLPLLPVNELEAWLQTPTT